MVNAYNTANGLIDSVTSPISNSNGGATGSITTDYTYEKNSSGKTTDRLTSSYIDGKISLDYTYEKGNLTSVKRGGYKSGNTNKLSEEYTFTYNDYGQTVTSSVAGRTLMTNTYDEYDRLARSDYGNGSAYTYEYDIFDRVTCRRALDTGEIERYTYDYRSNIWRVDCSKANEDGSETAGLTYIYDYDSIGRLLRVTETDGNTVKREVGYGYDSKNRLSSIAYYDGLTVRTESAEYNDNGTVSKYTMAGGDTAVSGYDGLNRTTSKIYSTAGTTSGAYKHIVNYTYKAGAGTNQATELISQMRYSIPAGDNRTYGYTYDNQGNITEVTE